MDPKFLAGDSYSDKLHLMLRAPGALQAAVAFWGKGAEKLIAKRAGQPAQILCNLQSGACNPYVIKKLKGMKASGILVKTSPHLHAKVVITEKAALIGSANISANGLSLEGAQAAWDEAGLYTEASQPRQAAIAWFKQQWEDAEEPDDAMIEAAAKKWRERGGGTPSPGTPIADLDPEQLRGAYFTIYDQWEFSEPAKEYVEQAQKKDPTINGYEGWGELPYNADLINLYWPSGSKPYYEGVWRRCKRPDQDETPEDGKLPVQLVAETKKVLGRRFTAKERKGLFDKYMGTLTEMLQEYVHEEGDRNVFFALDEVGERWAATQGKGPK
jgi:hypothetical protein